MTVAVGIDVGATKTLGAVIDPTTGRVLHFQRIETRPERGGAAVLEDVVRLAGVLADGQAATIGVGLCEIVGIDGGIRSAETIDWRDLDVSGALASIGAATIDSDVRAGALAEAVVGAGRSHSQFVYITVGTGISHCLVLDGRPYPGAHGQAIVLGTPPVERVASGRALAARAGMSRAEDVLASREHAPIVAAAAHELGRAIAFLVNAVDPEIVVIGGGLGLDPGYRATVTAIAITRIEDDRGTAPPIVPAATGTHAGVIGAALVAAAPWTLRG